jgi:viologen exporter family transport system permease protein
MGARPLNLYPRLIRYGLAYIIPITLCSTLSATTFTEGFSPFSLLLAILSLTFLFALARLQWNLDLRRYASASS